MSDYVLLQHCSPTLAGIKTGNLVTCSFRTRGEVQSDVARWNRSLGKKGIRVLVLKYMEHKVLLYLYRPAALRRDLRQPDKADILRKCGYACGEEEECIRTLIRHLEENSVFPHEIGLFIGYPAEDVEGFIRNRGGGCKYSGMWKVYGNVEERRRLFEKYRHCTEVYCRRAKSGKSIEELAVSISPGEL